MFPESPALLRRGVLRGAGRCCYRSDLAMRLVAAVRAGDYELRDEMFDKTTVVEAVEDIVKEMYGASDQRVCGSLEGSRVSEIRVEDSEPWWLPQRGESRHLQVWCGDAYLLVRKEDGYTTVGYSDEEPCQPSFIDRDALDWLRIFQWRADQTFPWRNDG